MVRCLKIFFHNILRFPIKTKFYSTQPSHAPSFSYLSPHLNYKYFISNAKQISKNIINRNLNDANILTVCSLYETFRNATTELNALRSKHNELSKSTSFTKESRSTLIQEAKELKQQIQQKESQLIEIEKELLKEVKKYQMIHILILL